MSNANPYATSGAALEPQPSEIRRVSIRPIDLLHRGYEMIRENYWLFLGLALATVMIASVVPFGILFGPMFVGLTLCFLETESGKKTSFDTLFKGFDSFGPSFVACMIHAGIAILALLAWFMIAGICAAVVLGICAAAQLPDEAVGIVGIIWFVFAGLGTIFFTIPMQYAMMFSIQSIADKRLEAWDSVVTGYRAIWKNLWGYVWLAIVWGLCAMLAMLMCYIPLILLMPVMYAAMFVLYRDIVPKSETMA